MSKRRHKIFSRVCRHCHLENLLCNYSLRISWKLRWWIYRTVHRLHRMRLIFPPNRSWFPKELWNWQSLTLFFSTDWGIMFYVQSHVLRDWRINISLFHFTHITFVKCKFTGTVLSLAIKLFLLLLLSNRRVVITCISFKSTELEFT